MLYLHFSYSTLALKLFRGEPAISEFDWYFSAIHSSSQDFSTSTWFGPPRSFTSASTWPWIGHPVSGLRHDTIRSLQTRFRFGSVTSSLNLASHRNSPDLSTKSTLSGQSPRTVCKHKVSGSFSLPSRGSFHLSLTVLLHYRSSGSI